MLSVPPSPSGNSTTGDFDELQKSLGNMSLATDGDEQAPALLSEFTQIQPIEGASLSDSGQTLSPEPDPRLRRVPKAHHNMRADDSSPRVVNEPTSALFEYADMQLDTYTPSPNLATTAAGSLAPSSSPLSLPLPRLPRPLSFIPTNPVVPPPVPPSLPFEFRASATWITPEQRYSGFAENLMLNAALFDTIRRESNPSSEEETEVNTKRPEKRPAPCNDVLVPAKDDEGVYIPTWRRKEPGKQPTVPLWADPDYSSDAAILSEAAELTFELYESLHSLR
ncbi:hypothetical protein FBU59_004844 [Linderina macrospora]|uniref:Uncharacterized protein n=1 Tax=Linderina macrospora TaxID=4868 RepID=A0ACC1J4J7_9FUNG|nr:hypothetical protein FBU59_004844 [Linderina macrospora]